MPRTIHTMIVLAALTGTAIGQFGCDTAPATDTQRQSLQAEAKATMDRFRKVDTGIGRLADAAAGYAVIPSVTKGGLGVGGAYGRGILYVGGKPDSYCDISQATIGLQIGGQEYSELVLLQDQAAVLRFKANETAFSAQASAIAASERASADANYKDGVIVFTMGIGGLMAEASVGGQKFTVKPMK